MNERYSDERQELLVILEDEQAAETLDHLRSKYRVSQMASPRVVVIESRPAEVAPVRSIPGVKLVTLWELPPNSTEGLDDGETLFVRAWVTRIEQFRSKLRRGEGLSWDSPGFEPPDSSVGGSEAGKTE